MHAVAHYQITHYRKYTCIHEASKYSRGAPAALYTGLKLRPNMPPSGMSDHCTGMIVDTPRADTTRAFGSCNHRASLTPGQLNILLSTFSLKYC